MKAFRFRGDLDTDPPEAAAVWAAGCRGMQQDGPDVLAWFDEEVPLPVAGTWSAADDTDWLAAYYRGLEPVRFDTLVVAPSHAPLTLRPGQRPLWLDPGMAFGTGHHETTRMILAALDRTPPAGRRVLDVGAGSGILAIAADLLGAAEARGVDNDPGTVAVARENAARNRSRATFEEGTLPPAGDAVRHDLVVANLFAELHVRLLPAYRASLAPGGRLLMSGILTERAAQVRAARPPGLREADAEVDGDWTMLTWVRT